MACCYPDECGEYAVTPMLVTPLCPSKCPDSEALCYPCLPSCPKGQIMYCCEKRPPKAPPRTPANCCEDNYDCHDPKGSRPKPRSPPPSRQSHCNPPLECQNCGYPSCKPVKTKYVMPCYRYEDGRIVSHRYLFLLCHI